jgi:hypothetical protein
MRLKKSKAAANEDIVALPNEGYKIAELDALGLSRKKDRKHI